MEFIKKSKVDCGSSLYLVIAIIASYIILQNKAPVFNGLKEVSEVEFYIVIIWFGSSVVNTLTLLVDYLKYKRS
jgi:hypothetical protein